MLFRAEALGAGPLSGHRHTPYLLLGLPFLKEEPALVTELPPHSDWSDRIVVVWFCPAKSGFV